MKTSILIILNLMLLSCTKSQKKLAENNMKTPPYNIEHIGDGLEYQYDSLSIETINYGETSLKNFNYKFPNKENFEIKIEEVFNFDISSYTNNIIVLRNSMFPEIVITSKRYILIQNPDSNSPFEIDNLELLKYNQYIFYNDSLAYTYLKSKSPQLLKDLVVHYGYNKDKELVAFVLNNFDFTNENLFHDLIFSYNPQTGLFHLKEGVFEDIEKIIYKGKTEDFSYAKEGDGYMSLFQIIERIDKNKTQYYDADMIIAFLFERELRVGIQGHLESYLSSHKQYKSYLQSREYFNFPRLKKYLEVIHQSNDNSIAIIHDPDGFTNLRKDKTTNSEVLQKIKSGEYVEVLDSAGDWYLVKTKEGKKGYVHKSRIKTE